MSDWALYSDGSNDVISIGSAITVSLGTWQGVFLYEGRILTPSGTVGIAGTSSSSTVAGPAVTTAGAMVIRSSANITIATSPDGFIIFDEYHVYEFQHDSGGAWRFVRDGSTISSGTYTGAATWTNINQFLRASNSASARLNSYTKRIEFTGVTNGQDWDANLSGGTGSIFPTGSGSNQGTLLNFPTNDSQWIDTAPAGSITSTISYDLGDFGFAASANVTAPVFTATADYDLGAFGFGVSASNSVPLISAGVAYSVGDFGFDVVADNLAPPGGATVSFSIGDFGFSVNANSSVPALSADAVFDLGDFGFAVVSSIASNNESASVAFDLGSFGFAASASVINPPITAMTAFDMGSFGFSVFATQPSEAAPQDGATITFTEKSRTISFVELSRTIRFVEGSRTIKF